jgi:hypothetical protein
VDITAVWNHIADVDADAETGTDRPIGRLIAVAGWHLLLDLHRTAHCSVHAVEHHKQRIAAGIDDPAAMLLDGWVDSGTAESAEPFKRSNVIQVNQAAITNHVGMDDSYQLPPS